MNNASEIGIFTYLVSGIYCVLDGVYFKDLRYNPNQVIIIDGHQSYSTCNTPYLDMSEKVLQLFTVSHFSVTINTTQYSNALYLLKFENQIKCKIVKQSLKLFRIKGDTNHMQHQFTNK